MCVYTQINHKEILNKEAVCSIIQDVHFRFAFYALCNPESVSCLNAAEPSGHVMSANKIFEPGTVWARAKIIYQIQEMVFHLRSRTSSCNYERYKIHANEPTADFTASVCNSTHYIDCPTVLINTMKPDPQNILGCCGEEASARVPGTQV